MNEGTFYIFYKGGLEHQVISDLSVKLVLSLYVCSFGA